MIETKTYAPHKPIFQLAGVYKTIKELENQSEVVIDKKVPYPFSTADEMLDLSKNKISISEMKRQNELVFISEEKLKKGISELWDTMSNSINSGLKEMEYCQVD